jgi:RNA 2',3'-cyclic 3'-phosphodiesterase
MISSETGHRYIAIMPRLFAAFPLPPSLITAIQPIQRAPFAARWQDEEQLHLTLGFFGEVAESDVAVLDDALSAISAEPLALGFAGVGHFASKEKAHSLWARAIPAEPIAALAAKVAQAGRQAGCPVEARRFVAHVTVARLRVSESEIVPWLISQGSFAVEPVPVLSFGLYESRLHPGGSRYACLASYPLG